MKVVTRTSLSGAKIILIVLLALFAWNNSAQAQAKELWGMTSAGGTGDIGTIFKTDGSGNNHTVVYSFPASTPYVGPNGRNPQGSLLQASDGMLYGITQLGGANDKGVLFQFNPCSNVFTKKVDFNGTNGSGSYGNLIEVSGKLYGMSEGGGANGLGVLYAYDLLSGISTPLFSFDGANTGSGPQGSLFKASNGKLYGMTAAGGANGVGVLFEYTIGPGYTYKVDLSGTTGHSPRSGALMQASADGNLYGMTYAGGASNAGTIIQFNPATHAFAKMVDFDGTSTGRNAFGGFVEASGNLYGMTTQGTGASSYGVMLRYTPGATSVTPLFNFTGTLNVSPAYVGNTPTGTLLKASDGNLYAMCRYRGNSGYGNIFQYNYLAPGYTEKLAFNQANGSYPHSTNLIEISASTPVKEFWGMTSAGGTGDIGTIFKTDGSGNNHSVKYSFPASSPYVGPNGRNPQGSLLQASDGMLYGITQLGGANDKGVLFQFNPITYVFTKKVDFNGTNGFGSYGNLIEISGKLYGISEGGGANGLGVLYAYDLASGNSTALFSFDGANSGSGPQGSLFKASNGKLYGMTAAGGANGVGVLFEYTIGPGYTYKLDLSGTTGHSPRSGALMQASADGNLYGMTYAGGASNAGTIIQFNPATHAFAKMVDFDGTSTGRNAFGGFVEASGNLYGMTTQGTGASSYGVMLRYTPGATSVTPLFNFTGTLNVSPAYVGNTPTGTLLKASDGNLYAMCRFRGNSGYGNIFQYNYLAPGYTEKLAFNQANGSYPHSTNLIEISACTSTCTSAPAQPSAITGPGNVCGLSTATYTVTAVAGVTYTWTLRPGMTNPVYNAARNHVVVTINQNAGITFNGNITVTASNACGTSPASSRLVNLVPGTPASLTGPSKLCGLTTATYTCTNMGTGVTYNWTLPIGMTGSSTSNTINVSMTGTANISGFVSVTLSNACGTGGTQTRGVNSAPNGLTAITGPTDICSGSFVPNGVSKTYSVTALPASQFITHYTWSCTPAGVASFSPNSGPNDNSTLATLSSSYPTSPSPILKVKATNQCNVSVTRSITVNRSTSPTCTARPIAARSANTEIDAKQSILSAVNIYPNPSNGLFSVKFNASSNYRNLKFQITNLLGQTIYQSNITNSKSEINISSQQSGMYLIRLIDKSGTVVERQKLVKE